MKITSLVASLVLSSMAVACTVDTAAPAPSSSSTDKTSTAASGACTPVADSTGAGVANPAAVYCQSLGYTLTDETCAFADGTSCEEWSFYRGECGGAHSFCALHGGVVSNKTEDMGTWTASYALCTMPGGASCEDSSFASSCKCE